MSIFNKKSSEKMLRTIIIDDEAHMRLTIAKLINDHCRNVDVIGEAEGVKSGIEVIKKLSPDLILLDIKMRDGTGFDLLKKLDPLTFKVIFITAYHQYAVKAFKHSAVDYILKPVDQDELKEAINRAESSLHAEFKQQLNALEENMSGVDSSNKKIVLKTSDYIHILKMKEILYCNSDNNYTVFHLLNGKEIIVSKGLKEYDEMLSDDGFFRMHKSYLINLSFIKGFDKSDGGFVVMEDGTKLPVSSRKKDKLMELFDHMSKS